MCQYFELLALLGQLQNAHAPKVVDLQGVLQRVVEVY